MTPNGPLYSPVEKLRRIRVEFEREWHEAEQARLEAEDICLCRRPVPGPSYLKVVRCVRCTRVVT